MVVGIRAIRGSQNRRGAVATRELIRVVRAGHDIGVTPDGSGTDLRSKTRGLVCGQSKPFAGGSTFFYYTKAIRLKSWDRFAIPFPFYCPCANLHIVLR